MTFLGQKLQKRIFSPTTEVQIRIVQVINIQIRVVQGLAILQKKSITVNKQKMKSVS